MYARMFVYIGHSRFNILLFKKNTEEQPVYDLPGSVDSIPSV